MAAAIELRSLDRERPLVVLITLESIRTDHVGAYGGASRTQPKIAITPTLDRLAVAFQQSVYVCYQRRNLFRIIIGCQCAFIVPSLGDIFA